MKYIYFTRHGETNANIKEYVPGKDEPLNETGLHQAHKLAERIAHIEFEKIYVSDFLRAQQTVRPMSEVKQMEFETNGVFGEMLEPSSLLGTPEQSDEVQFFRRERDAHIENAAWRMEDGETFHDVFQRIKDAKSIIETTDYTKILIVSHGFFAQLFAAAILTDSKTPNTTWHQVARTLRMSNTGMTLFTIDNGVWRLLLWNDYAHFAE